MTKRRRAYGPTRAVRRALDELGTASYLDLILWSAKHLPDIGDEEVRRVLDQGKRRGWLEPLPLDHWRLRERSEAFERRAHRQLERKKRLVKLDGGDDVGRR